MKFQEWGIIKSSGWIRGIRGQLENSIMDADEEYGGDRWGSIYLAGNKNVKRKCLSDRVKLPCCIPFVTTLLFIAYMEDFIWSSVSVFLFAFLLSVLLYSLLVWPRIFCMPSHPCLFKICSWIVMFIHIHIILRVQLQGHCKECHCEHIVCILEV